jgi:hypothetical protein
MSDRAWSAAFLCASLAWASAVSFALRASDTERKDPPPPRMRIAVAAKPAAPVTPLAPVEAVEKLQTKAPEKLAGRKAAKTAKLDSNETPRALDADRVVEATATLPPQPALTLPVAGEQPALPLIGEQPAQADLRTDTLPGSAITAEDVPSAPPNGVSTSYPNVQPYGLSTVIAVLLDHEGSVLDVRIVVPSSIPLNDVTYSMALRGTTVRMDPPLAYGELRWFETKIDYVPKSQQSVLP